MTSIDRVTSYLEKLYPLSWAEDWDRVGLVLGDPTWEVARLRLAVDPTVAEAREAAQKNGTLLITHHPLLLRGASFLPATCGKGAVATELLRSQGGLWCGHTNSDRSRHGTVGAWIDLLRLKEAKPLDPGKPEEGESFFGLGALGELPEASTVGEIAELIAGAVLPTAQGVLHTGDAGRKVRRVAVCPGAGDSFLETATAAGVDLYITSDLRHHPALEHLESRADHSRVPALIDLPHYASESLYLPHLASLLREEFPELEVEVSSLSSDPFTGAAR